MKARFSLAFSLTLCAFTLLVGSGLYWEQRAFSTSSHTGDTWFTGTQWQQQPKTWYAPDFTLPDQNRHPISLHQFRGQVVLLSFTSSVCRQQCPLVGHTLAAAERLLGALAQQTVLVNISVDPEADTPHTVRAFAHKMGWEPYHWYYLWAARPRMKPIWQAYDVYVPTPPPIFKPGLQIIHLAAVALIDKSGRIRGYFAYPFLASQIAQGMRHLIKEST
jgi:protein SCO1/2